MTRDAADHEDGGFVSSGHRSGFVAVVGKPNVGKSTLMNRLLGEKLAIVSPKPQTTRDRQLGILTRPDAQIAFVDTPGIHQARSGLGKHMVKVAVDSVPNADITLFLVDGSASLDDADREIVSLIVRKTSGPIVVGLNKRDLADAATIQVNRDELQRLLPSANLLELSAATGDHVDRLLAVLIAMLPLGPRLYPVDQITDTYIRDNAAEVIREKILELFEEEVPHSVAVVVDEFKERSVSLTYIAASIYVEKDSQKGILIGKKGAMLKKIGVQARPDLEELTGTPVYLDLWVKVLKDWRRNERALRRLGYYHKQ